MPDRRTFLTLTTTGAAAAALFGCRGATAAPPEHFEFKLTDAQWKAKLSPQAYQVLRHESTETPFTSPLNKEHRSGTFACAGCGLPNFSSRTKFDSGTGWPSFWAPLANAVRTREDGSLGMSRVEVHCRRCGGHLGHVFDDGPKPTGKRYCMNGVSLAFKPA
ncbi:peptide-methionine (R)-S-oxide reductase MsrB [Sphingomonas immobilis]|uniref:peptide-methionine (R)-S-oxide reductase n=1 Tax=Sphingomonas immobilis TaxID=3063997 RepID=A0ABT9A4X0_9SPHN|nr:peptide-methionine (R)-S-oxide reductase MsrB [Sphingomonas sp. CA1-15]MDO7844472.1 peptide-methionine (R)-S-oxide reductase MsrB [Sphingomonas sp. CA1-15]